MGIYERDYTGRMALGQSGNMLTMLLAINLLSYVILGFIKVLFIFHFADSTTALTHFHDTILYWFAMPVKPMEILYRPWTIITQLFVHNDFWSIFGNMIWLWTFGYIFQDLGGNRRIVPVYIYGGVAGALSLVLVYNNMPSLQGLTANVWIFGASPAVMAVAMATTLSAPNYRIFPLLGGGIPLWVITVFYLLIDLASIPYVNPAVPVSHIVGALMGLLFIVILRNGMDMGKWMNAVFDWIGNLFNPNRPKKGKSFREELFYRSKGDPYTKQTKLTQQRVDMILDKINQQGFNALTNEEKELLKKAGENDLS